MSAHRGGYGASREGLNARAHLFGGSDQIQINVDPGQRFDYEAQLQDLRGDVLKIKHLARAIDEERKLQGQDINALEEALEKANAMMKGAMKRLRVVSKQSRSWMMLWLVLFGLGLFLVLYLLSKVVRVVGRLGRLFF